MRRKAFLCVLVKVQRSTRYLNVEVDIPWPPASEDILSAAAKAVAELHPAELVITSLTWIGPVVDE